MFNNKEKKKVPKGGIPKGKSTKNIKGKSSLNAKSTNKQEKQIKVDAKPKMNSKDESAVLNSMDLGNEVVNLPVYSTPITERSKIDAFIVDVLQYTTSNQDNIFRAYFVGDYKTKSFSSYIKGDNIPSDYASEENEVINLKRKGM